MLGIWEYFWNWSGSNPGNPAGNAQVAQLPLQVLAQSEPPIHLKIAQLPVQILEQNRPPIHLKIGQLVLQILVQKPNQPRVFIRR